MDRDELQGLLRSLHRELGEARSLDPESRRLLGEVMTDIARALQDAQQPAAPMGERLDDLAVRFEADHPGIAGAIRQLIDALAKAGI